MRWSLKTYFIFFFAVVHDSNIYLFGGFNCRTKLHLNDFWKFNMNNWRWSKIRTLGNAPSPRRRMTCFLYNDYVYFYGGTEPKAGSVETSDEISDEDGLVELGDIHLLELGMFFFCFLSSPIRILPSLVQNQHWLLYVWWRSKNLTSTTTESPLFWHPRCGIVIWHKKLDWMKM